MSINAFFELTPALIGFIVSGLILCFLVLPSEIRSYFISGKIRWKIIISSLFFLSSGFIFQIITEHRKVFETSIFTVPVTVITTALGIFLGNTILRYIDNIDKRKEQKEIAVIFINTIDSQINFMSYINYYLSRFSQGEMNSDNKIFNFYY